MFDPINGPAHAGQGPSTNDSTENGDSWHAAVAKVNGMFKSLFSKLEAPIEHVVTAIDEEARTDIKRLEDEIAALQQKLEAMAAPAPSPLLAAISGTTAAGTASV